MPMKIMVKRQIKETVDTMTEAVRMMMVEAGEIQEMTMGIIGGIIEEVEDMAVAMAVGIETTIFLKRTTLNCSWEVFREMRPKIK